MTPNKMAPRAILFRIGGLGDLLVALPAIALSRRVLPGHRLTLAGRAEYVAVLLRAGIVDEAIAFDDPRMATLFDRGLVPGQEHKYGHDHPGPAKKCGPLAGVEIAMGWWNRSVDWAADEWWVRRGIGRTGFVTYDGSSGQPISRFFFDRTLSFFETSSSGASNANPDKLFEDCERLAFPPALIKKALDALNLRELRPGEKRLVVHPGSGGRAKRWPLPNFIEAVRRATSLGINGVLVTGEAEEDLEPSLNSLALPPGWTRVSRLPAETLAGLLASSTHYVGNDSGPTHLAAACGARVLAFFRDDNLPAWLPFGRTRVLSAPDLDRIPLASAFPVIDDFLAP